MESAATAQGQLMNSIYRSQRHIYDATRKYYLFGRDRMIKGLDLPSGGSVLEIGCGTGRNLAMIARLWPAARLFGLDISTEMLTSAAAKLGARAVLARGDATAFDALPLFGRRRFDRVVLSFATSMIPEWEAALAQAAACVARGGSLHIVDFGDLGRLPSPLKAGLKGWLARFHVSPRIGLIDRATALAARLGHAVRIHRGRGDYYVLIELQA